jgi:hypothetical protein
MTFLLSNLPLSHQSLEPKAWEDIACQHAAPYGSWYLSEQLVLLFLSDDDIEEKLKFDMQNRLLTFEVPVQFRIGKLELPVILMSTELSELTGSKSWILLKVAEIPEGEVQKWIQGHCKEDCVCP